MIVFRTSLFVMLFFLLAGAAFADPATVSVRGEAELQVPADRAVFDLAVVTEDVTSEKALQQNNALMENILAAIQKAGLEEKEISTGQFTITPRWSSRPRQAPEGWRPDITGFVVNNRLQVKTLKLDLVGKILGAAVKAGSNEVQGLYFDLSEPREYRREAIRVATERALEDARVLADAGGSALGGIISLNLDDARSAPVALRRDFMMAETAGVGMAPPVMPGDVTVRASVTAVFELNPVRE